VSNRRSTGTGIAQPHRLPLDVGRFHSRMPLTAAVGLEAIHPVKKTRWLVQSASTAGDSCSKQRPDANAGVVDCCGIDFGMIVRRRLPLCLL